MMEQFRRLNEKFDRFNEKLSEPLDRDAKSVEEPVITKIEDGKKETELKEDKNILLSTNKNNSHKEWHPNYENEESKTDTSKETNKYQRRVGDDEEWTTWDV